MKDMEGFQLGYIDDNIVVARCSNDLEVGHECIGAQSLMARPDRGV